VTPFVKSDGDNESYRNHKNSEGEGYGCFHGATLIPATDRALVIAVRRIAHRSDHQRFDAPNFLLQ
jgi:hypothetical protein